MTTPYMEKLKDPRWQKKRLQILERDGWQCIKCGDGENTLHVHHRRYIPKTDPWNYPESALVTLCDRCHEGEREEMILGIEAITEQLRDKFFGNDLRVLAAAINGMEFDYTSDYVAAAYAFAFSELQTEIAQAYYDELKRKKETEGSL